MAMAPMDMETLAARDKGGDEKTFAF